MMTKINLMIQMKANKIRRKRKILTKLNKTMKFPKMNLLKKKVLITFSLKKKFQNKNMRKYNKFQKTSRWIKRERRKMPKYMQKTKSKTFMQFLTTHPRKHKKIFPTQLKMFKTLRKMSKRTNKFLKNVLRILSKSLKITLWRKKNLLKMLTPTSSNCFMWHKVLKTFL